MKQNPFLGSPAPLADPSKTYREGRRRSALERNPSSGKQNHVTLSGCGLPHLQPLARLLQRLLLGSGVGRNRVLGLRRYLWLLKRHHQRRRQPGSGFRRSPRSARLDGSSPLEGLPLESARLRSALQHRGPGWWSRTTALRGEEASQQLLRRLLLQQQLWLQLRRSKQRRRSKLARRRGRSFPPAQQEGWKDNAQRLRRPLRRSRRRHQLKAQENLGRRYRELELRLLTYRLVAALEPKRQAHRRRGRRAHWRHRDPAHRLLHWLRGGSLPERRGSGGAPRELWQRLRRSPLGQRQLRWRRGFRRWRRHGQQLKALRYLRAWLRWRERLAAEAKSKREEEEGEAPQELPSSTPANPEELRLEEEDREREAGGFSRLSQRLLRLENLLRGNPRATAPEGNPNPSGDHRHRQRRAAVLEATAALLRRPGRSQRSELARALRRWRRSLLRERSGWLLQHPLLRHPAEERVLQHLRGLRERLRQEEFEREVALAEQQRQNRGALAPSGLGHPDGQAPARSPEELRDRWATYFLPDPKNGFSYFSPLSLRAKKGLFQ